MLVGFGGHLEAVGAQPFDIFVGRGEKGRVEAGPVVGIIALVAKDELGVVIIFFAEFASLGVDDFEALPVLPGKRGAAGLRAEYYLALAWAHNLKIKGL